MPKLGTRVATGIYWQGKHSYSIRVSTGKKGEHSYQYYTETFHGTVEEAKKRRAEILIKLGKGEMNVPTKHLTLGQYIDRYLEDLKLRVTMGNIKKSTAKTYEEFLRYFKPLRDVNLARLRPKQLTELYAGLMKQGVSPITIHDIHRTLRAAWNQHRELRVEMPDILNDVRLPIVTKRPKTVYDENQAQILLDAAKGHPLRYGVLLVSLYAAPRISEVLALKWNDVDFENNILRIDETLYRGGCNPEFTPLKTAKREAVRYIPMVSILADFLRWWKKEQIKRGDPNPYNLLFPATTGNPLSRKQWHGCHFLPLVEASGLPRVRPHDIRHSAARMLIRAGVPLPVVKEILGHAQISTTVDIYADEIGMAAKQEAIRLLEEKLTGKRKKEETKTLNNFE